MNLWDTTNRKIKLQQFRYMYSEIGQIFLEEDKQYTDALRRLTSSAWHMVLERFGRKHHGNWGDGLQAEKRDDPTPKTTAFFR
ncbi:hypothetical protein [Brevibacillus sp. SYSU BS000544]|uniref:hypothetical protein n=1 Tax=Brevibacillus sp. SYSU BS000544 TaxID=3416443 RepID=UPI003CE55E21